MGFMVLLKHFFLLKVARTQADVRRCAALNLLCSESCSMVSVARGLVSSSDPVYLPPSAIVGLENFPGLPRLLLGIGGHTGSFFLRVPLTTALSFQMAKTWCLIFPISEL